MKPRDWVALIGLSALLAGCSEAKKEQPKEANSEKASEPESRVKHGTNGEIIVTVKTNVQQMIGLQTARLAPSQVNPELKAYGHVLDISPLASLVADLATAEAAGQASQAELKRLKTLAAQNNTSERAVQTAQAAATHDQAQIQSIRLRLLAGWGSSIAQRNDLIDFVQTLGSLTSVLVELEVPASDTPSGSPTGARIFSLSDETNGLLSELVGPAPVADPQMQGQGFLFLVSSNSLRLVPGSAVTGLLSVPGETRRGVLLPRSAIVRFNGTTWVYRQTSEETFERNEVALGVPLENGWFVATGLKPQEKVVTVGGQQLLSEELKGQFGGD